MKLLFLCHDFLLSGANRSLLDLLEDNSKIDITVVIPKENKEFRKKLEDIGCNVIVFNHILCIKSLRLGIKAKFKNCIRRIYFCILFNFKIKMFSKKIDCNFDFVITNSFSDISGYYIAKRLNIPHIFYIREFMEADHKISHIDKKIDEICANSYAIFISKSIESFYLNKYRFKNHFQIYDKIKNDFVECYEKKDSKFSVCIVGSLVEGKGHSDIIYAINELNKQNVNLNLYIAGEGPLKNKLIHKVKELGMPNVIFCGQVANILSFIKNCDILVSCSNKEALGRVMIEAMYVRTGVIGTASGEAPILLDHGRGFLYESGDFKKLASIISNVISNKIVFNLEESRKFALQNFSGNKIDKIVSKLDEWSKVYD